MLKYVKNSIGIAFALFWTSASMANYSETSRFCETRQSGYDLNAKVSVVNSSNISVTVWVKYGSVQFYCWNASSSDLARDNDLDCSDSSGSSRYMGHLRMNGDRDFELYIESSRYDLSCGPDERFDYNDNIVSGNGGDT